MPRSFVVILYTALQFVLCYWCESLLPTRWYIFGAIKRCFLFLDSRVYPWSVQPRWLSWGEMGRRCGRHQVALSKTPVKNCGKSDPYRVFSVLCFCFQTSWKLGCGFTPVFCLPGLGSYHIEILHLGFVGPDLLTFFWNSDCASEALFGYHAR